MSNEVSGFSKWSKEEKIQWLSNTYFSNPEQAKQIIQQYWNADQDLQNLHDEFIENTISNFYLPLGIAPNFLIDGTFFTVPMAIEESSVVAAAAKSAKYWSKRGGFKTTIVGTEKIGQVHFMYHGSNKALQEFWQFLLPKLHETTQHITQNMQKRGGGILNIELKNQNHKIPNYYQLHATFDTKDSMGANFINSCLEQFAKTMLLEAEYFALFEGKHPIQVIMSILSNYVTNCVVRAEVSCPVEDLVEKGIENPQEFAEKMVAAVKIAEVEPYRAVTHNKGIMNGIDAVVLATGNDFRAVEAAAHAYASKDGVYSSLSHASIENGIFRFWLEVPLALGTVGGLTSLHPLVKIALQILQKPSAEQLMRIVATVGLAQNFAALRSLTTKGIQEGHMKMHLNNILNQYHASPEERKAVQAYVQNSTITHASVASFLENLRKNS
jgi:hydroxymethylglutaryl-CoA reductase